MNTNTADSIDLSTIPTEDLVAALESRQDALVIAFTRDAVIDTASYLGASLPATAVTAIWNDVLAPANKDHCTEFLSDEIYRKVESWVSENAIPTDLAV